MRVTRATWVSGDRRRRHGSHRFVVVALCVVPFALFAACSSETNQQGSSAHAQMCETANAYVWHAKRFGGSPPDPAQAKQELARIIDLADSLATQVPEARREQARAAPKGWKRGEEVFAKYDYGREGDMPTKSAQELREAMAPYLDTSRRFTRWLTDECAPDEGDWPTPPPEQ